ncbi:MAG: PEP/pyruvate-binding domain-containing protein, partial [bacterium]
MQAVLELSVVTPTHAPLVGAKAASLARMKRAGLPVPDGFVVSADVYSAAVAGLSLPDRAGLAAFRSAIESARVAPERAEEIRTAFAALGSAAVAVRSSATAEDLPGHSFAGLYDSFLETTDPDGCVALVRRCWASLWTDRAFDYRERNGFVHADAAMAVVVQRLVPAENAGVAFTADPVTGAQDRIVVEAVSGLADKLVSGRTVPDRFTLDRRRLRVTARTPAGTTFVIADAQVREVARLSQRAEKLAGSPQDVEWAASKDKVWLVQSRPITALKRRSWADRQVWSSSNAAEVLPSVLTPLVWSTLGQYLNRILGAVFERIGVSFGTHPLFGEVAGRVYTNLNTFTAMVRRMPFANRMSQAQMFGGAALSPEDRARLELDADEMPDIQASAWRTLVRLPGFLLWLSRHGTGRGRRWMADIIARNNRSERPDLARFDEPGLLAQLDKTLAGLSTGGDGLGYALVGMMYTSVLYDLCRRWLGDTSGAIASRLLAGTGELLSAQAGIELWRLGRAAAASEPVRAAVLAGQAWPETRAALEDSDPGRDFLARWDSFARRHGHHARGEMDPFQPRWSDQPGYLLGVVRGYAAASGHDPEADIARRAEERDRLAAELHGRFKNPLKRVLFRHVVAQAQRSAAIRENLKDIAIRVITSVRAVICEIGRRLVIAGRTENPDDVFFLELEEIAPALSGKAQFAPRERVAARRAEYERNLGLTPPAIVVGRYDPATHRAVPFDSSARTLKGLAVSPGRVTGPARVVLLADATVQVMPGEILVAPFTDPGWTPYFIPAAGIVIDQGGLMSHGSIIAREYGIP